MAKMCRKFFLTYTRLYTLINHTAAGTVTKFKKNSNILLISDPSMITVTTERMKV